jgi:hypothetical protein
MRWRGLKFFFSLKRIMQASSIHSGYQTIYGVQLLDDLHNYFPDILYNSGRFGNVGDLLGYIQTSTQNRFNLYNYGRSLVGAAGMATQSTSGAGMPSPAPAPAPAEPAAPASAAPPAPQPAQQSAAARQLPPGRILRQRVTASPLSLFTASFEDFPPIAGSAQTDALFASLFGELIGSGGLRATENLEPVRVRPTEAQIAAATQVITAESALEDPCTICQDTMDVNTSIRKITACGHQFHKTCIDQWFLQNVRCPVCRHDVRQQSGGTVNTTSH